MCRDRESEEMKDMQLMHEKVKELTDRKKNIETGRGCIMSTKEDLLFEMRKMQ